MTFLAFVSRLSCMTAIACAAASAQAEITVFEDQASFLQATVNPAVDTFETLFDSPLDGPLDRSAGSWSYNASVDGGFFAVGTSADNWLSTNQALPITFSGFSPDVSAVGGFFFTTDVDGALLGGESVSLTATDTTGSITRTVFNPSATSFLGFVSTTGSMLELRVSVIDTGFNNAWATVNDLTLAQSTAPVPEPTSAALLLCGLAAMTAVARRRQR